MARFKDIEEQGKPLPEEETMEEQMKRQLVEAQDAVSAIPGADPENPPGKDPVLPPPAENPSGKDAGITSSVETPPGDVAASPSSQETAPIPPSINSLGNVIDRSTLDALQRMAQKNGAKNSEQQPASMPNIEEKTDAGPRDASAGQTSDATVGAATSSESRKEQEETPPVDASAIRNLKVGDSFVMNNGEQYRVESRVDKKNNSLIEVRSASGKIIKTSVQDLIVGLPNIKSIRHGNDPVPDTSAMPHITDEPDTVKIPRHRIDAIEARTTDRELDEIDRPKYTPERKKRKKAIQPKINQAVAAVSAGTIVERPQDAAGPLTVDEATAPPVADVSQENTPEPAASDLSPKPPEMTREEVRVETTPEARFKVGQTVNIISEKNEPLIERAKIIGVYPHDGEIWYTFDGMTQGFPESQTQELTEPGMVPEKEAEPVSAQTPEQKNNAEDDLQDSFLAEIAKGDLSDVSIVAPDQVIEAEKTKLEVEEKEYIDSLPLKDKRKLFKGLTYMGFTVQEWKAKLFRKAIELSLGKKKDSSELATSPALTRLLDAAAKSYKSDEDRFALMKAQGSKGLMKKIAGVGGMYAIPLRYGRALYDITTAGTHANPFRYVTMGALMASRGAKISKEARLMSGEAMDATRVADVDHAFDEAQSIYLQAKQGNAEGPVPSMDDIRRAYSRFVPDDLAERLSRWEAAKGHGLSGLMQRITGGHLFWSVERINKKMHDIEASDLSVAEKQSTIDNLLARQQSFLHDLDRMVGDAGMVDQAAYWGHQTEKTGKRVANVLMLDSLRLMIQGALENALLRDRFSHDTEEFMGKIRDIRHFMSEAVNSGKVAAKEVAGKMTQSYDDVRTGHVTHFAENPLTSKSAPSIPEHPAEIPLSHESMPRMPEHHAEATPLAPESETDIVQQISPVDIQKQADDLLEHSSIDIDHVSPEEIAQRIDVAHGIHEQGDLLSVAGAGTLEHTTDAVGAHSLTVDIHEGESMIKALTRTFEDQYHIDHERAGELANRVWAENKPDDWNDLVHAKDTFTVDLKSVTPQELGMGDIGDVAKQIDYDSASFEEVSGMHAGHELPHTEAMPSPVQALPQSAAPAPTEVEIYESLNQHPGMHVDQGTSTYLAAHHDLRFNPDTAEFSYDINHDGSISDQEVILKLGSSFDKVGDVQMHVDVKTGDLIVQTYDTHHTMREVFTLPHDLHPSVFDVDEIAKHGHIEQIAQMPEPLTIYEIPAGGFAHRIQENMAIVDKMSRELDKAHQGVKADIERLSVRMLVHNKRDMVGLLQKQYGLDKPDAKKLVKALHFVCDNLRKGVHHNDAQFKDFSEKETVGSLFAKIELPE